MRIRSTKPEFWRSHAVASIAKTVVYDGPLPRRVNEIAPMSSSCEYVYLLFDDDDGLIYVGRSFRPADRITKHRRKSWWFSVSNLVIIRVEEDATVPRWRKAGPNTARLEALAIQAFAPQGNVAAASRRAML